MFIHCYHRFQTCLANLLRLVAVGISYRVFGAHVTNDLIETHCMYALYPVVYVWIGCCLPLFVSVMAAGSIICVSPYLSRLPVSK